MSENSPIKQQYSPGTILTSGITATQDRPLLEVRLLGSFDVQLQGRRIDLHHRKADLLFACLAIFGNWVERGTLEDMLWPEVSTNPIDKAAGVIRELLGENQHWLEVRRGKLRLNLTSEECDLTLFDRAIRQRDNADSQQIAIEVYGPLIPHALTPESGPDALPNTFVEWLLRESGRRETQWREALERAVFRCREATHPEEALFLLRRYVQAFPKSERAWTLYLRTALEAGDRLEGLSAFDGYREALHRYDLRPFPLVEELRIRLLESGDSRREVIAFSDAPAGGTIHWQDPRYVLRAADQLLEQAVKGGASAILLVKGPRETGKSSLVARQVHEAQRRGTLTLLTDFKAFPQATFHTTESLCLSIAIQVAQQISQICSKDTSVKEELLSPEEEARISKVPTLGLELFIQRRVLNQNPESKILWVMDRVDRLFGTPSGHDFFSLLRSWHDKRTHLSFRSWRRLQIGLVSATEATLFLQDANQSPFNVGQQISVGDFTLEEVRELNQRFGERLKPHQVTALFELLSGHPTLTSRFLELVNTSVQETPTDLHTSLRDSDFDSLVLKACREDGFFGEHLARLLETFSSIPELRVAVQSALVGKACSEQAFLRLRSAGVLTGPSSDLAKVRCSLYAKYLERRLSA